jgi:glycosyltransferase involved in cell wall biosynthesis
MDMIPQGFRKVSTLHDMWTEQENCSPKDRLRSLFKRRALENSDAIVCISYATYDDLARNWPHLIERACVIHHGARLISTTPIAPRLTRPYFLYVGQREERKNFAIVLKGLAAARRLDDFRLVCAGGGAFNQAEIEMIHQLGLSGQLVQCRANDHELAGLYENAVALLYPSRFEGFGMPVLEAMLHGCPVVSSPDSCMPEIAGNAAIYADAVRGDAWTEALEKIAFDTDCREKLQLAGRSHAAGFSWDLAGERYEALYRSLL